MNKKELIKKVIKIDGGGLTRNGLIERAENDDEIRLIQKLISEGYLENYTVQKQVGRGTWTAVDFIRVSEKGHELLEPFYKRIFLFIKDDTRTVLVSVATTILTVIATTLITNWIDKVYGK